MEMYITADNIREAKLKVDDLMDKTRKLLSIHEEPQPFPEGRACPACVERWRL